MPLQNDEEARLLEGAAAAGKAWFGNRTAHQFRPEIDAVVTWVDGEDAAHRERRALFLARVEDRPDPNGLVDARFVQNDEIRYCLRSIRNYAPWIRKIWLVTDRQFPKSFQRHLVGDHGIEVVDHREVFPDEDCLPTFNSLAIETCLWRIPNLAERYIYFNDDVMLTGPVSPAHFFTEDGIVVRGRIFSLRERQPGLHSAVMRRAARMAGFSDRYVSIYHSPYVQMRSVWEGLTSEHADAVQRNMQYRFRDRQQFSPISLHHHTLLREERAVFREKSDIVHLTVRRSSIENGDELRRRLEQMFRRKIIAACLNDMETVQAKVPDVASYLDRVTGPPLAAETAPRDEADSEVATVPQPSPEPPREFTSAPPSLGPRPSSQRRGGSLRRMLRRLLAARI